jgi:glycosyltransferase involved in cell wall biosynthesis
MGRTLREHHPDALLTVLLLDAEPDEVTTFPEAQLLGLAAVVGEDYGLLAAANPAGTLQLALLPHLLRVVLATGEGSALFIADGQRVLGPLSALLGAMSDHEFVLVARARSVARATVALEASGEGAFSRRLLGLRAGVSSSALLDAWPSYFAITDDDDGAGAARAWMDSIPALVEDVAVLRDHGYGLDPWSLAGTQVSGEVDALEVDGLPARVLDFSQLDPDDPQSWFDGAGRVRINSALAQLAERQAEDLRNLGWTSTVSSESSFGQLQDGLRLTGTVRSLLVDAIIGGAVTSSPYHELGRTQFYRYLNEPDGRGRAFGLSRLHMAIWERRPELQSAYPHIEGPDGSGFAGWLCVYAAEQEGLVPELLPPTPELAYRDADPHAHKVAPRLGVNTVGFFTSELGVGEVARLLVSGLDARGIPALPISGHLAPPSRQGASFAHGKIDDAAYPINIICINGDGIPVFAREAGRSFFEGRHTIAVWWWEVGRPPASWTGAYDFVDEVWVASQYVYDAIAPTSPVPVVRITLPLPMPEVAERTRAELGLPDGFVFLYVHDYHSVFARKHPIGLIEAFCKAFPPGSGAKLVLKSINASTRAHDHERAMCAAERHPDITLIDGYVSGVEKNAMIAKSDCYISLHRSEGFGLTLAEAMLMGKPVIATRFGGNMEYMSDETSYLVDYEPVAVGEGVYPYPPDGVWADPDLDQAAALMRHVFHEPAEAQAKGRLAREEMMARHSPAAAGAVIERRLRLIAERMYADGTRSLNVGRLPPLADDLRRDIGGPPSIGWGRGMVALLKRLVHRPVERWTRSYVAYQFAVDSELRDAVTALDERLRDVAASLKDQQNASHAEMLAELRRINVDLGRLRASQPESAYDDDPERTEGSPTVGK